MDWGGRTEAGRTEWAGWSGPDGVGLGRPQWVWLEWLGWSRSGRSGLEWPGQMGAELERQDGAG